MNGMAHNGPWYARFEADFNTWRNGSITARLVAYVMPHELCDGDEVTLSDPDPSFDGPIGGTFRGWVKRDKGLARIECPL